MRIAHFISSPAAGGAETYVRDMSIAMSQQGHDVHIIFLQSALDGGRDLAFESGFLNALTEASVSYSFIGHEARRRPWLGILKLRRIIKDFKADVLHCHLYFALLFSFFVAGVPVIYTHHNIRLNLPKLFYRLFDKRVSRYVAICSACKNLLQGHRRQVVQINNAVSSERILKKAIPHAPNASVTFVYVGGLYEQKNLKLMLSALNSIRDQDFSLLVVGEGPDKNDLMLFADSLNLAEKVFFLGNVSNVSEILANSDVFLMSSAWEGLPIALIEATLAGLPVIVTNVGGCAEVVHRCANGFVVDTLDVQEYSEALKNIFFNPNLRSSFSANALAFSHTFDIEPAVASHLALYDEVLFNA